MDTSNAEIPSQAALLADDPCRRFFLQPQTTAQRQYEALRAVIVEGLPQKDVAQRFGYTHDSLRQLLRDFRASCRAGEPPPFSPRHAWDDHQEPSRLRQGPLGQTPPKSPTLAS
jgi:DNA-directed RNA polymerase specialized sigma24 family protein